MCQPLTIKVGTDNGRREIDLVFDFHFQNIAQSVFYGNFYADDVTKAFKIALTSLQYYAYHEHAHNMMSLFT